MLISWHRKADHNYKGLRPLTLFSLINARDFLKILSNSVSVTHQAHTGTCRHMTKMINCRKQRNNGPNSLQQTRFSTHHNSTITDNHPSDTTPPPPIQGALYRSSGPFSKASKKARDRVPELMPPDSSTSFPMLRRRVRPVAHNHAIGRLIYLLLLIEHRRVVALLPFSDST